MMKTGLTLPAIAALASFSMLPAQAQFLVNPTGGTVLFSNTANHIGQTTGPRQLGFTDKFFGAAHTTVDVSVDGVLSFPSFFGAAHIAPLWDNLELYKGAPGAAITESAGPGYYAVTWNNLNFAGAGAASSKGP